MLSWSWVSRVLPHLLIVLFALAVTSSVGWYITYGKLDAERLGRIFDKTTYEKQQETYTIKALNEARTKEAEYARIKQKADASYSQLSDAYRTSIVRYKAAQGKIGRNYLSSAPGSSSVNVRPGEDTLIPVPESDLLICAENTAKAQVAHDWAVDLQKNDK